jgi:L-iditol 2-dehydrogenase
MKALIKTMPGPGNVDLLEVPEPDTPSGGVKVAVAYTGICGTDLHVFHDTFRNYPPVILGHEFSGTVAEVGDGVTRVQLGDRVVVLPSSAVIQPHDAYWRQGYYMFCADRRGMGHGVHGSFTRYAVVREDQVYLLPENVSLEEAALAEPLASAFQAVCELTHFTVGETVLVSGPGPIGLLCVLLLVAQGCRVIVAGTEQDRSRLRIAGEVGTHRVVDVTREDLDAVVRAETLGRGVAGSVEAAGHPDSIRACLQAVRPLGRYVQVGISGQPVTLSFDQILFKQIQLFGSVGHSLKTWEAVMQLLRQQTLDLTRLVTHKLPLSRWREAFELCESKEGVKVLLSYDEANL